MHACAIDGEKSLSYHVYIISTNSKIRTSTWANQHETRSMCVLSQDDNHSKVKQWFFQLYTISKHTTNTNDTARMNSIAYLTELYFRPFAVAMTAKTASELSVVCIFDGLEVQANCSYWSCSHERHCFSFRDGRPAVNPALTEGAPWSFPPKKRVQAGPNEVFEPSRSGADPSDASIGQGIVATPKICSL